MLGPTCYTRLCSNTAWRIGGERTGKDGSPGNRSKIAGLGVECVCTYCVPVSCSHTSHGWYPRPPHSTTAGLLQCYFVVFPAVGVFSTKRALVWKIVSIFLGVYARYSCVALQAYPTLMSMSQSWTLVDVVDMISLDDSGFLFETNNFSWPIWA